MYDILKERDPGRLIDSTSGWFAQQKSDFDSEHVYFREKELVPGRRPMLLSECGGFILDMTDTWTPRHPTNTISYISLLFCLPPDILVLK